MLVDKVPVMLVTGPSGTGKTTVCWEMRDILRALDVPHALVDLDNIRWCHVPGSKDRYNTSLGLRNLADLWRNFRAAGATHLLLSGVVESRDEISRLADAVPGAEITTVRLTLDHEAMSRRIKQREQGLGLERTLARAAELAQIMEANDVGDHVVDADRGATELARELVGLSGWTA